MAGAEPVHADVSGHAVNAEPFAAVCNGEMQQHAPIAGSFYLDEQQTSISWFRKM
jgi:hypothetical protein